jgi:AcrR family transcriptional regulator
VIDQAPVGLRERKKRETRRALTQAALELFVERGYDETTLADIAEAAGVSTRTIFSYFPSKEDILFCPMSEMSTSLAEALAARPAGMDALATLREFILAAVDQKTELDRKLGELIAADATLTSHQLARIAELRDLLAAAIADDLGASPNDLRPQVAAASLTAALETLERQEGWRSKAPTSEEVAAAIDPILAFVRAGLQALPEAVS